jgi:DNA-binding cell septation regulator SpoVG
MTMETKRVEIEVLEVRLVDSEKTKAFVDLRIGDLVIRDFRVMKENGKRPFVRAPFSTYRDQTGHLNFRQIVVLPDEVRGKIDLAILNAYHREMEKKDGKATG